MRPSKILTWNTCGSYLYYLTQAPQEFHMPSKPGRPRGYAGRCGPTPWGPNVQDMPADGVRSHEFDCIVCQDERYVCLERFSADWNAAFRQVTGIAASVHGLRPD